MNRDNLNGRVKRLERHQRRDGGRLAVLRVYDARTGEVIFTLPPGHENTAGPSIDLPDNGRAGSPKLS